MSQNKPQRRLKPRRPPTEESEQRRRDFLLECREEIDDINDFIENTPRDNTPEPKARSRRERAADMKQAVEHEENEDAMNFCEAVSSAAGSDDGNETDDEDDEDDDDDDEDEDDEDDDEPTKPVKTLSNKVSDAPHGEATQALPAKSSNGPATGDYIWHDYLERLIARRRGLKQRGLIGPATGIATIDQATGGIQGLTILAGPTQSGKTSLAVQFLLAALQNDPDLVVLYFLLDEMSEDDLIDQFVCNFAHLDFAKFLTLEMTPKESERLTLAAKRLRHEILPRVWIVKNLHDPYGHGLSGKEIFDMCQYFLRSSGAKRPMVVVDMIDDIPIPLIPGPPDDPSKHYVDMVHRIEADPSAWRMAQLLQFRQLSEQICLGGYPLLGLAKLRKSNSGQTQPRLDDLLGSVDIAYKAARVYFLIPQPGMFASPVPTMFSVVKGRRGRSVDVPLSFHYDQFRFEESPSSSRSSGKTSAPKRQPVAPATKGIDDQPAMDPLAGAKPMGRGRK